MQKRGGSVLKRSRIFKSGINRRAMKAARESIALLTEEKQGKADYSSNYLVRKIFVGKHNQKSQSAMEYLMTYGWAILIIAVVLGALYSLGVFNSTNFAPKAPPGSCHVFRPNGPGTSFDLNLEGVCNGELPEYVASFNGQSSRVQISQSPAGLCNLTVTAWSYDSGMASASRGGTITISGYGSSGGIFYGGPDLEYNDTSFRFEYIYNNSGAAGGDQYFVSGSYRGKWIFAAMTFNGINGNLASNGIPVACINNVCTPYGGAVKCGTASIGWRIGAWDRYFNGSIANVQLYNTSLSASEIQALYQEGIGGAPIDLQNLIGWWPLNGDTNDYSGNGNNGVPSSITFVSNWYSGYTPP
ncbi:MAG: LamG-like jellyroll fold domain-containing protein [Candidatus Micrarchaeaceae archaeon]